VLLINCQESDRRTPKTQNLIRSTSKYHIAHSSCAMTKMRQLNLSSTRGDTTELVPPASLGRSKMSKDKQAPKFGQQKSVGLTHHAPAKKKKGRKPKLRKRKVPPSYCTVPSSSPLSLAAVKPTRRHDIIMMFSNRVATITS
jgi:hypothetical protein